MRHTVHGHEGPLFHDAFRLHSVASRLIAIGPASYQRSVLRYW
jgi:hypothetical protein